MKCATPMCPRSARIAKYCPDCALPDHAAVAADGAYRLYTGRYTAVLSGVQVTQGPLDGGWPSYAAATAFLDDCRKQAAPAKRRVPRRKAPALTGESLTPFVRSAGKPDGKPAPVEAPQPAAPVKVPRRRKAPSAE